MNWEAKLGGYTMDQLQRLARNAVEALSGSDAYRAREAEQLLSLIEAERASRSLPGNIERFLRAYPLGFNDPEFLRKEREEKLAASHACRSTLTPDALDGAAAGDPSPLAQEVKRIVNMTNLIQGSFEKPKLFDVISDPAHTGRFLVELRLLMHGAGEAPERLEAFSTYLHSLGLRKWTYGSYFLFLIDPERCMFVKPESLKKAIEITGQQVDYHPVPTAAVYRQVLAFADWISVQLKQSGHPQLVPQDMIDVQSFIWHMAPTGKYAC